MEPSGTFWAALFSVSQSSARTFPDLFLAGHSPSPLADTPTVTRSGCFFVFLLCFFFLHCVLFLFLLICNHLVTFTVQSNRLCCEPTRQIQNGLLSSWWKQNQGVGGVRFPWWWLWNGHVQHWWGQWAYAYNAFLNTEGESRYYNLWREE